MKKIIKYWTWDERMNLTKFKLRENVSELVSQRLLIPLEDNSTEYTALVDGPYRIQTRMDVISAIIYRNHFPEIPPAGVSLWEMDIDNFELAMNQILEPTEEDGLGDKLCVIFRDFFVSLVIIRS